MKIWIYIIGFIMMAIVIYCEYDLNKNGIYKENEK
jgi:hypothetical protein